MKAGEMRIGNYMNWQLGSSINQGVITSITTTGIVIDHHYSFKFDSQFDQNRLMPITLTEGWLLKFGFVKINKPNIYGWYLDILNRTFCWCWSDYISIEFKPGQYDEYLDTLIDIKCEYVHQLQNLYFVLTGNELTIKS